MRQGDGDQECVAMDADCRYRALGIRTVLFLRVTVVCHYPVGLVYKARQIRLRCIAVCHHVLWVGATGLID